jgi:hypothetical protein
MAAVPVRQPVISFPAQDGSHASRVYVLQGFVYFGLSFTGLPGGYRQEQIDVEVNAGTLVLGVVPPPIISATVSLADVANAHFSVNAQWGVQVMSAIYDRPSGKIRMTVELRLGDHDGSIRGFSYTVVVLARDPRGDLPQPGVIEHPTREHFNDIVIDHAEIYDARIKQAFISSASIDVAHINDLFVDESRPPRLRVIFVRPENNPMFPFPEDNDTGKGTSAEPYHSLRRALRDVPVVLKGSRIVIDCTGMGRIDLEPIHDAGGITIIDSSGYQMPPCLGMGRFFDHDWEYRETPGGPIIGYPLTPDTIEYELAIMATPEATGAEIPAGTVESDELTGLRQVTVPGASWVEDEFAGLFAEWGPPDFRSRCPILRNSTTTLYLAMTFQPQFPIAIVKPSAELHLPAGFRGLEFSATIASINLFGIKVSTEIDPDGYVTSETPLTVRNAIILQIDNCVLEGIRVDAGSIVMMNGSVVDSGKGSPFAFNGAYSDPERVRRVQLEGGRFSSSNTLFKNLCLDQSANGGQVLKFLACGFIGCTPVGHGEGIRRGHADEADNYASLNFALRSCVIRGAVRSGVNCFGGGINHLLYVSIEEPAEHGVFARGPGLIQALDVVVSGAGGSGYFLTDGAQVRIAANLNQADRPTYGTAPNQGFGISAEEASQVRIEESAGLPASKQESTTGTLGDVRVGSLLETWAGLRAARRAYDSDDGTRVSFTS